MNQTDLEDVAHHLGMKPREIVDVVDVDGVGLVVTTHDGTRWVLTDTGVERYDAPADAEEDDDTATEDRAAADAAQIIAGLRAALVEREDDIDRLAAAVARLRAQLEGPVEEDEMPSKVEDILAWVGRDTEPPARAQAALETERATTRPRSTLVAELERLVSP